MMTIFYQGKPHGYIASQNINHKKNQTKVISTLDIRADELFQFELEQSKDLLLIEASYNGKNYAFLLVDIGQKELLLHQYNSLGQKLTTSQFPIGSNMVNLCTEHVANNNHYTGRNRFLHHLESDEGFLLMYPSVEPSSSTYYIHKISSDSAATQSYPYKKESPIYDAIYLGSSRSALYFSFQINGKYQKQFTCDILSLFKKDMTANYELNQPSSQDIQFFPYKLFSSANSDTITLIGHYFENKLDMIEYFYSGYALWKLEPLGDITSERYLSFQKDISSLSFEKDNQSKDFGYLLTQEIIKSEDNAIRIIVEGYKKIIDGASMGYSMMNMRYMNTYLRVKTTDIVILELDDEFRFRRSTTIDKKTNTIQLSVNPDLSVVDAGKFFNQFGFFDYIYTEQREGNAYTIYYRNFGNFMNRGTEYEVGKMEFEHNRYDIHTILKQPNTSSTFFFPNQNNQLMIAEWIRKKKKIYFEFKK